MIKDKIYQVKFKNGHSQLCIKAGEVRGMSENEAKFYEKNKIGEIINIIDNTNANITTQESLENPKMSIKKFINIPKTTRPKKEKIK